MYTNRAILVSTAIVLLAMYATSLYGLKNGLDVLISDDDVFNALRLGLVGALGVLLVTQVPRSLATRWFVGLMSLVLVGVTSYYLLANYLYVFDGVMFGLVAIILALEAIEPETTFASQSSARSIKVVVE